MNAISQPNCPSRSDAVPRKPHIALMGEFSAGKSTLMNLLLGFDPLPVQITATRVPPVWVSYGPQSVTRIRTDGVEEPLTLKDLAETPLEGTKVIRVTLESELLEFCDLFDIPGISDPNISHEDWSGLMDEIDSVIWCTHATQAWRQSEAAIWEEIVKKTNGNNILVVTQFDKLQSERNQSRVLARLRKETGGLFQAMFPLATLEALTAGDDEDIWRNSGGAGFVEHLVSQLVDAASDSNSCTTEGSPDTNTDSTPMDVLDDPFDRLDGSSSAAKAPEPVADETIQSAVELKEVSDEPRIVPRRVRPKEGRSKHQSQRIDTVDVI